MTPKETRNEKLATKIIKHLARRNMKGHFCRTSAEAIELILKLIPEGSSITWGGSMTIRDMGLTAALHAAERYSLHDRDTVATRGEAQEIYRMAFTSDFYISGINALSEDGVIVNIDGTGNRVAAITFGPKQVILVAGMNKVCRTAEAALARARSTAAPINAARFDISTPCHTDGACHNCNSPECICNYIHFLRNSPGGRHTVILVDEELGY